LAQSNADRQRNWRERHKGEPRANPSAKARITALQARVVELEAQVVELGAESIAKSNPCQSTPTARFRLEDEIEEQGGTQASCVPDWSDDEEIVRVTLDNLIKVHVAVGSDLKLILPCLADLVERAAPQFVDACRRRVAWVAEEKIRQSEARTKKRIENRFRSRIVRGSLNK
jgi:hypothetical protein